MPRALTRPIGSAAAVDDDDHEFALVSIGGTLTHMLFSDNGVTTHNGFMGAAGPIKATGSDDYAGLS